VLGAIRQCWTQELTVPADESALSEDSMTEFREAAESGGHRTVIKLVSASRHAFPPTVSQRLLSSQVVDFAIVQMNLSG